MKLSDPEKMLLREIQQDASASLSALAHSCGMAQSTVWRKLQEFEAAGLIWARVALLDPAKAGVKLCIFAQITLEDHSEEAVEGFARIIRSHPNILEAHSLSGTADYILKIRAADVEDYEHFMSHTLLRSPYVRSVVSSFSLRELKHTTELPL